MPPLRSQDLRHIIEFLRPTDVSDGKGGYTTAWTTIATARAEVRALDGRESVMANVLEGQSVFRIRIRWRASLGVRASDQAKIADGRELNITSAPADPDGRRRELVMLATTASAQATA